MVALHVIPDWMVPYLAYMNRGELPEDETLARQIIRRSKSMTIINGELHHCSVTGAFQRCVSPEEGREILREIHKEIVVTTPVQNLWWPRRFVTVSIG